MTVLDAAPTPAAGRDDRVRAVGVLLEDDQALVPPADREARFRRTFHIVLVLAVALDLVAQAVGLVPQGSSWALAAIVGSVALLVVLASPAARSRRNARRSARQSVQGD